METSQPGMCAAARSSILTILAAVCITCLRGVTAIERSNAERTENETTYTIGERLGSADLTLTPTGEIISQARYTHKEHPSPPTLLATATTPTPAHAFLKSRKA